MFRSIQHIISIISKQNPAIKFRVHSSILVDNRRKQLIVQTNECAIAISDTELKQLKIICKNAYVKGEKDDYAQKVR